ncbi:UPF0149 family protein [Agarilytica rhodophyticola]|uniref:UPF0149 family protein n=1 Tax=Agarilytica rhodophyticola TaxID=1737490 RepID=UPI000B34905A|nr:UPF0149 family protein [Agarilytica rhodophyticola]
MQNNLDFFVLNEMLLNIGSVNSPAELQGMLCGLLCGGKALSEEEWRSVALDFMDLAHITLNEEQQSNLIALYELTARLLEDVNFSFMPMLPGDESTITRRTQELGYWCQGLLHGLGVSGLSGEASLSPEVADALRDLAQISLVSVDEDDDLEENEAYWLELVEYVKVAVLTVYTELSESNSNQNDSNDNSANDKNNVVH